MFVVVCASVFVSVYVFVFVYVFVCVYIYVLVFVCVSRFGDTFEEFVIGIFDFSSKMLDFCYSFMV